MIPLAPLFHPRVLQEHCLKFAYPQDLTDRFGLFWGQLVAAQASDNPLDKWQAIHDLFCGVLGYRSPFAEGDSWELDLTDRIFWGYFSPSIYQPQGEILVSSAPVPLIFPASIDWLIVTDLNSIALYYREYGIVFSQVFQFAQLHDREQLERFYALFCRRNLLGNPSQPRQAKVYQLLELTEATEEELGQNFYRYCTQLYHNLTKDMHHRLAQLGVLTPQLDQQITRLLLHRLLIVQAFTDRGLLPPRLLQDAYNFINPYVHQPVWVNFRAVFRWLDQGNRQQNISPLGIKFFQFNEILDRLIHIGDELCRQMKEVGQFNLQQDVHPVLLIFILQRIYHHKKLTLKRWRSHKLWQQATNTWNRLLNQLQNRSVTEMQQVKFYAPHPSIGVSLAVVFVLLQTLYGNASPPTIVQQLRSDDPELPSLFFSLAFGQNLLPSNSIPGEREDQHLVYLDCG
ncbi:MAG: hypothetical protein RMK91_10505 [Pseudanabaenaceae cyanobacterium SKYGB_i_bin29]|nr:hypothetical protein [Pseudanabaenaceae cyanobacterium SKYG29]MDW8422283.1 hypothetical protein [Pseudanabaenaceae cyanobacterium SKYGB_i_bin29]